MMAAWSVHARDEAGRAALSGGFSDAPGIEADPAQGFEGDREQSTLPQMSQPSNRCWMTCEKSPSTLVGAMEATTLFQVGLGNALDGIKSGFKATRSTVTIRTGGHQPEPHHGEKSAHESVKINGCRAGGYRDDRAASVNGRAGGGPVGECMELHQPQWFQRFDFGQGGQRRMGRVP
ncbi:hypothetical protein [Nonomuraea fuscirosea]|uniref:hypothetical protein n=1 Tax=Nonomuraea fuscirosea TaxID=1291556 RepID=UPI003407CEFF